MHRRTTGTAALAAALAVVAAAPAWATPPGTNGQLVWQRETTDAPPRLWVANPDGSGAREVFTEPGAADFEGAFSPTSAATVAFSRGVDEPFSEEIFVGDLATGQVRQVTDSRNIAIAPTFSPDGTRIAFFRIRAPGRNRPPGEPRIAVIGTDGTGFRLLTPANRPSLDPDFSPDGDRIVYAEFRPGGPFREDNRIMVMDADGGNRRAVTRYGGRLEINPKWLPDGSGIVFESMTRRRLKSDIERIGIDGEGRSAVLRTPAFETNPVPSPDGTRIVFTSDRDRRGPRRLGPGTEVYTMGIDGTGIVRLTDNRVPDLFPDWQRLP